MTILQPIATQGCGCDQRDTVKSLISIDAALTLIREHTTTVRELEEIPLGLALGRILASPVCARSATPPFDNAAMDGYAVTTAALTGAGPWELAVVARVPAGRVAPPALSGMSAARIFTGAPVPAGADAVVMQEDVQRTGESIRIKRRPLPGQNIRRAGTEMAAGTMVLGQGRCLGPREIAACAAAGAGTVRVQRRLRVALLVTGDEVRPAGTDRAEAQIWDVNTPMLSAALTRPSVDLVAVECGADCPEALLSQLARLAGAADLLITTGGISVGEEDHVKPALQALGVELAFSGVAIKPGKPVSFGRIGGAAWLGLPGNPLSAFITWQLFGSALIHGLTGEQHDTALRRHVVTAQDISRKTGRCEVRPAIFTGFDPKGREVVTFDAETHSARASGLVAASGLIFLPADTAFLPAGALVEYLPFCPT